jgi:tetratricopeptide (TPR) repeat protein
LALANGNPQAALDIAEQMIAHAEQGVKPDGRNIFRVSLLRGQALAELGRYGEAADLFEAAREVAAAQGAAAMLWKVHVALGCVYRSAGRDVEAQDSFAAARAIVQELESRVADASLRQSLSAGAREWIDLAASRGSCGDVPPRPSLAASKKFTFSDGDETIGETRNPRG